MCVLLLSVSYSLKTQAVQFSSPTDFLRTMGECCLDMMSLNSPQKERASQHLSLHTMPPERQKNEEGEQRHLLSSPTHPRTSRPGMQTSEFPSFVHDFLSEEGVLDDPKPRSRTLSVTQNEVFSPGRRPLRSPRAHNGIQTTEFPSFVRDFLSEEGVLDDPKPRSSTLSATQDETFPAGRTQLSPRGKTSKQHLREEDSFFK